MALVVTDEQLREVRVDEAEARLAMALRLFEDDRVTLGQAAILAGLPQLKFQRELALRRISLHYDMEDLEADLRRSGYTPA
jgi:predicted HTH domain antitoxin